MSDRGGHAAGTVAGILERHELTPERVLRLALGEDAA